MKLEYIGHACFRMTAQDGTCAITDPYDGGVGIAMLPLTADLITMSHEHHDHNCEDMVKGHPLIVHGDQPAAIGGIETRAVLSFHDDAQGAKRGANAIRIFTIDGLKVVHMGDQGCMPSEDVISAITGADVMMIPVGGYYTIDAKGAQAIIQRAKPRCVIPMHFLTQNGHYSVIGDQHAFLTCMGVPNASAQQALTLLPGSVPEGVVLMQPQADALR